MLNKQGRLRLATSKALTGHWLIAGLIVADINATSL